MSDQSVTFNWALRGALVAPVGSELTETGSGVRLPNGDIVRVWDVIAIQSGDDERDLTHSEAEALGIFIDGDLPTFDGPDEIIDGQTIWPPAGA
ncbi:hypothetical protein [Sphingomonas jaspsi]|uniref:hypothetical protein n=1 Tax=Sphingomonas jaspsi TaxID=392409 RepID=UPI0004B60EC7|nr:hypothetical protein [Sphingomonas jaspsi]